MASRAGSDGGSSSGGGAATVVAAETRVRAPKRGREGCGDAVDDGDSVGREPRRKHQRIRPHQGQGQGQGSDADTVAVAVGTETRLQALATRIADQEARARRLVAEMTQLAQLTAPRQNRAPAAAVAPGSSAATLDTREERSHEDAREENEGENEGDRLVRAARALPPLPAGVIECPLCCEDAIGADDSRHFFSFAGRCPMQTPHRVCSHCLRRMLADACGVLNARDPKCEWLLALACSGKSVTCPFCDASPEKEHQRPYTMAEVEVAVRGDETCACALCAHARTGDSGFQAASAAWTKRRELDEVEAATRAALTRRLAELHDESAESVTDAMNMHRAVAAAHGTGPAPATVAARASDTQVSGARLGRDRGSSMAEGLGLSESDLVFSNITSVLDGVPVHGVPTEGTSESAMMLLLAEAPVVTTAGTTAARRSLGSPTAGNALLTRVSAHQSMMAAAHRSPFGVFRHCPVSGCESREYVLFDDRRQFFVFFACGHEMCRNCERPATETGPGAHKDHNRGCYVTLGSQLVRLDRKWDGWDRRPTLRKAVEAMHCYAMQLQERRSVLQCPRCGIVVAKSGACNHVICACGEHLCQCCHRRIANLMQHATAKAANAHAPAPYATYVAVDEAATVQNHYETGGWRRREPQKRLCPRGFAEFMLLFPALFSGDEPAPGQSGLIGQANTSSAGDVTELRRQSHVDRLRVLALILNPKIVDPAALKAVKEFETKYLPSSRSRLFDCWPGFPVLSVHECVYLLWEWGRGDRCDKEGCALRRLPRARVPAEECREAAMPKWALLPRGAAAAMKAETNRARDPAAFRRAVGPMFAYNPNATWYPTIDTQIVNLLSVDGAQHLVAEIERANTQERQRRQRVAEAATASSRAAAAVAAAAAAAMAVANLSPGGTTTLAAATIPAGPSPAPTTPGLGLTLALASTGTTPVPLAGDANGDRHSSDDGDDDDDDDRTHSSSRPTGADD